MDIAEDNANNAARPTKIGPGERLAAERIKKGLSLEDVARRMHLSTSILEAIEENNFDEITAPIFVKGYLRAYARIVALSEDEMIEQYLDMYSEEDPPISSTSNMVPELSVKDARIKWTTYLVIVVLGVLLAAWWWNKQQSDEAPISLDAQTSGTEEIAGGDESVVSSEVQAGSETLIDSTETAETRETVVQESVTTTPLAASEPTEAEMPAAEPEDTAVVEPEPVPEPEAEAEAEAEAEDTAAETESSMAAEPEAAAAETATGTLARPERTAPTGSDKLQIIVHADTWGDVKDASNHQLVYDLLRADTSIELMGQAPFAVFLGNGHGVEILFNGEGVEIAPRIRDDNTARLNIGG
ncbi:MAG: helix-turn-helix domain-containing protein [Gammaproteobacteria bacterium]|nr:helix-turn-helix domain-containing protein [Gammaproteobacteria bacterium]